MSIIFHIVTAAALFMAAAQGQSNGWITAALFILGAAWTTSGIIDLLKLKRGKSK